MSTHAGPLPPLDPLYRISDVCRWLSVSRPLVESLIRRGELPIVQVGAGRLTRIKHSAILAYLAAREERGGKRKRTDCECDSGWEPDAGEEAP